MNNQKLVSALIMLIVCVTARAQLIPTGTTFTPTENNPDGNVYVVTNSDQNNLQAMMYRCNSTGHVVVPAEVKEPSEAGYVYKITSTGAYDAFYKSGIISITFPEGVITDSESALRSTKAVQVNYPKTLKYFSDTAMSPEIAKITVAEGNTYFYADANGTSLVRVKDDKGNTIQPTLIAGLTRTLNDDWTTSKPTSIDIPEGVVTIAYNAIKSSDKLTTINCPSTLDSWDDGFYGEIKSWTHMNIASGNAKYKSCDGIVYSVPGTTEGTYWTKDGENYGVDLYKVPVGRTFPNNTLDVEPGVVNIKSNACATLRSIVRVNFPESLKTIEDNAFISCNNLKEVSLGKNVNSVISTSFASCGALTDIYVNLENEKYKNGIFANVEEYNALKGTTLTAEEFEALSDDDKRDGILFNADMTHLMTCPVSKTGVYTVPEGTTTIDAKAFFGSKMKQVNFSSTVTLVGEASFQSSSIESVYVGPSVTKIDRYAFYSCGNLKKVVIGNKVERIECAAFWHDAITDFSWEKESVCRSIDWDGIQGINMETVWLPKSIETLGTKQFTDAVKKVVFEEGSHLKSCSGSFYSGTNIEEVDLGKGHVNEFSLLNGAFQSMKKLKKVFIPNKCKSIDASVFAHCTNLEIVEFEEGSLLETIGTETFSESGLISITLPDNLKTIGSGAFRDCTRLTDVHVPSTTTSIHPLSFIHCSSLVNIDVERANQTYATSDGMLCSKDKKKLIIYPNGKITDSFNLLCPSITTIGQYSFYDAKNLKSIVIPKKVNKIENYAFYLCTNLKMITFLGDVRPESVETDVATDNADADDNKHDHRFGYDGHRGADFIKENVTINIRHNEKTQASFKASDSYWYGAEPRTSFEATYANSTRTDGKNEFEYMFMSDQNELGVVQCNSTDYTAVMPATAEWTDPNDESKESKEYPVKLIADYAFEAIPSTVKEMVFLGPIEYVGANAFNNGHLTTYNSETGSFVTTYSATPTSNIENIFFTDYNADVKNTFSTVRFGLNSNAKGTELYGDWGTDNYPEFTAAQNVYIPKTKETNYKTDWAVNFADQISYQIPGISISTNFGSFSREFDVDLSDINEVEGESVSSNWDAEKNKPKVIAYTAKVKNFEKGGNVVAIRVKSINCKTTSDAHDGDGTNTDGDGDGTYIPANTGVLLQAIDGTTPTDFYYRIGERKGTFTSPTDNIMMPVVENSLTISAEDNYIVSGGTYKYLTKEKAMPIHKSYLHVTGIANTPGNAKTLRLIFSDDEDESTGIAAVSGSAEGEAEVYDLSGRRLQHISKSGMYIVNGKKVIVK